MVFLPDMQHTPYNRIPIVLLSAWPLSAVATRTIVRHLLFCRKLDYCLAAIVLNDQLLVKWNFNIFAAGVVHHRAAHFG